MNQANELSSPIKPVKHIKQVVGFLRHYFSVLSSAVFDACMLSAGVKYRVIRNICNNS